MLQRTGAAILALMLLASPARAEEADSVQLFQRARESMKRGDCVTAVELLARSHVLDPSIGTALNAGICHEKLGNAPAAAGYFEFVVLHGSPQDVRRQFAQARVEELTARLARLLLVDQPPPGAGVTVKLDGKPIAQAELGRALWLYAGQHELSLTSKTVSTRTVSLSLTEGEQRTFSLEQHLGRRPDSRVTKKPQPRTRNKPTPVAERPHQVASTPYRKVGIAALSVGAAALAASLVTGVLVFQKKEVLSDHCNPSGECDTTGIEARDTGRTLAMISTVSGAVGVSALAVGGYLVLANPGAGSATRVNAGIALRLTTD